MPCCRRVFNPMLYLTINFGRKEKEAEEKKE